MEDNSEELRDYKFFCFDGKVNMFKVDYDRFINHRANYYDTDCNLLPYGEALFPPDVKRHLRIPDNIDKMIYLAESLAQGKPFVRVDLYNINGQIFFGELTFFLLVALVKSNHKNGIIN